MIAEIIVDIEASETDKIFDYIIPTYLTVEVGARVVVPFGARKIEGYCIAIKPESILPKSKLKAVLSLCDPYPVIGTEMLALLPFMKQQYNLKTVDVLRLFLPSSMRQNRVKPVFIEYVFLNKTVEVDKIIETLPKNASKQKELLLYLTQQKEEKKTKLNKLFGSAPVTKFLVLEVLQSRVVEVKRTPTLLESSSSVKNNVTLTSAQQIAVQQIMQAQNNTFLLHGVTGSGKTEVYMQVIARYLKQNKTAIMLVPEISLTPQVLKNFRARFGSLVAMLHSGLSDGERFDEWRRIKEGEAKVVVGARSAIFAPIEAVGVIIIDEEHDGSYYSESNPRYYTHEVAKFRAKYNHANLVLGSATPKIETYYKVQQNEYILLELPERINKKEMPNLTIVDMKTELSLGNTSIFSEQLKQELECVVHESNQAMIFLNRRGYSSFLRCFDCGYVPHCTDCDVSLVYHKHDNQLKCHFCNKRYGVLTKCPECGSSKIRRGGIGTQQIVEELKQVFPGVKILRMDNDTTTTKNAHAKILAEFANTKPSILVGTQMIAKGHDFPSVTLVGIVDADLSLHFSDYRATERTFELITQVAGRAGRESKKGSIVLQTYTPKHYVYRFSKQYDYMGFYEKELNLRKVTNFPPFSKIVRILVSGEKERKTVEFLQEFYDRIKLVKEQNKSAFIYLEAMKSPVKRIKNKFRYQILMRLTQEKEKQILEEIFFIKSQLQKREITCFVEIDPQNLS
jgi:primosomal protein N' (replication factor Y)